ncbi:MAG TPA: alpha-amylase family glycosyl hydrolase, partial [Ktedonobacterales bacterium]
MNLVDSHDTGRILWELGDTTGSSAAQIAQAKQTLRLIALFQMTWVGAPTIYYGDEAGQTQSTYDSGSGPRVDPGDRRTFPWDHQDTSLQSWYSQWIHVRQQNEVLQSGAEQTLLTDDANRVFAFQRRDDSSMALVILNDDTASNAHTVTLTVSNVGNGATFTDAANGEQFTVSNGHVTVPVNGLSGRVLLARGAQVRRPAVPQNVQAFHLNGANALQWSAVQSSDLAGYDIYRSNIANGLYTKVNASPVTGTSYTDPGTDNAQTYYYVVRAVSNQRVESLDSAVAKPVVRITFAGNLSPATLTATLNVQSDAITATVTAPGSTDQPGQGPWITAQIGYGSNGSNPNGWTSWTAMSYQGKSSDGQSDVYSSATTPEALGTSAFLARFSGDDGGTWTYAYVDHSTTPGSLTVSAA